MFSFFPKFAHIAFYLTPFDAATAQHYLSSDAVTARGIHLATAFHKSDADTLQFVAGAWQRLEQEDLVLNARRRAMWLDPHGEDNHKAYLELLIQAGNYKSAADWFVRYPPLFFPAQADAGLVYFPVPPDFVKEYAQEVPRIFDPTHSHEVRYSRFYYTLGLWYLSTEPEKTRRLWKFASQLQPKLSHFWIERAALEEYVFNDHDAAMSVLGGCLNNPPAAMHCRHVLSLPRIPLPGSLQKDIHEQ